MHLIAAYLAAASFIVLSLLHLYWGVGGLWPGHDKESLARTVVGGSSSMRMQGPLPCFIVAALLALAACVVLGTSGALALARLLDERVENLIEPATYGCAAILLVRGVGGFFDAKLRPVIRGSRYERLNVIFYSPLALALGTLTVLSLR